MLLQKIAEKPLLDKKVGEAIEIIDKEKRTVILDRDIVLVNSFKK